MESTNLIDWQSVLFRNGFQLMESHTSTYGNGRFTGSIICEEFINREWRIVDESDKKRGIARLIFCPFIKAENEFKPNNDTELLDYELKQNCKNTFTRQRIKAKW